MKREYVLITPAHNEGQFIQQVIESVIAQTVIPKLWVIVDDASTDRTTEIIKSYENRSNFIMYYRLQRSNIKSYYSHRTEVFLAGYEQIGQTDHEFIGSLDADILLGPTYYEKILAEFHKNPKLGIASGVYFNKIDGSLRRVLRSSLSTPGAMQLFRRQCYEQIGGYIPLKYGGDDSLADIMARMKGWETRSFSQYQVVHHRPTGTADGAHILIARFCQGLAEYSLATHPLFMLIKSFRRAFLEEPYFIGSLARLTGFLYGYSLREQRKLPSETIHFVRKEQIMRLLSFVRRNPT